MLTMLLNFVIHKIITNLLWIIYISTSPSLHLPILYLIYLGHKKRGGGEKGSRRKDLSPVILHRLYFTYSSTTTLERLTHGLCAVLTSWSVPSPTHEWKRYTLDADWTSSLHRKWKRRGARGAGHKWLCCLWIQSSPTGLITKQASQRMKIKWIDRY